MVKSLVPRGPDGRWPKGFSPNPGGRPPEEKEVVQLARAAGPDSVRKLIQIRDDPKASHAIQAWCADALLSRGFGKPREHVDITNNAERAQIAQAMMMVWASGGIRIQDAYSHAEMIPQIDDETGDLKFVTIDPVDAGL